MNRLNVRLNEMFPQPNMAFADLNTPVMAAEGLLTNQRARADARLEGDKCIGVKAYFLRTSNIGTVALSTDCTTPAGNPALTVSKNFDTAEIAAAAGNATDARCDNEVNFLEESTAVLAACVSRCRTALDQLLITRTAANAQVNLDPGLPVTWDDTTASPRILVPKADFTWDNLGEFEAVINNNKFGDFLLLTGRNFYNDFWKSNFQRLNDNERAAFAAYSTFKIYFDIRNMDTTLARRSTLAVDRNSYLFWNTVFSSSTPEEVDADRWVWYIADPYLKYSKNGVLVPVLYEVEVTKTCVDRTAIGQLQFQWNYYVRVVGGYEFIPPGANGEKGVLEFQAV